MGRDVFSFTTLRLADGSEYDVGGEWVQIGLFDVVSAAMDEQITPAVHRTQLVRHAERVGFDGHPLLVARKADGGVV